MPDDTLTAALAEIRGRYDLATSCVSLRNPPPGLTANRAATSAADVPRLLAAVDTVLARHVACEQSVRQICAEHDRQPLRTRHGRWLRAVSACPDCKEATGLACAGCDPICHAIAWPCPTVAAVREALS